MLPSQHLFADVLATVMNGYLRFDPDLQAGLQALDGKIIHLELSGLDLNLSLKPLAGTIQVAEALDEATAADVYVRATPIALWRLARGEHDADQDIYLQGDMQTARALQKLLRELEVDWEELLSRIVGDMPAHQMNRALRGLRDWGRYVHEKALTDTSDFLRFERRALPTRSSVERFLDDVDALRSATDRFEARLQRLQQRLNA